MNLFVVLLILSLVTFRLSRLVVKDTIFQEPRNKLIYWLAHGKVTEGEDGNIVPNKTRRLAMWRDKLMKLIICPYCVSVHVAGYVVAIHHFFVDPLPVPIWMWLAVAAGSLVVWEYVDGE